MYHDTPKHKQSLSPSYAQTLFQTLYHTLTNVTQTSSIISIKRTFVEINVKLKDKQINVCNKDIQLRLWIFVNISCCKK